MKKVLIIAGALHIGGAERVATNISKYSPKGEFSFDYLVFDGYENVYGPEIEQRGGRVITLPSPSKGYYTYFRKLSELIRNNHYSVVHSHTQFNSGLNLAVAKRCGVPIRIAHSHTTKTERKVSILQKLYEGAMRILLRHTATHFLACGEEAGIWMFGRKAFAKRGKVIKNGIDTAAFEYSPDNRKKIRDDVGIGRDAFVIGHAGTLLPLKNQEYLISILPKIKENRPNAVLLLLGAGSVDEKNRLHEKACLLNVDKDVIFGGGVSNVNEYLSAMDVFAFPSLREGTPLALLEAQANGLSCVVSDRIPRDAFLTDLVKPLSLGDISSWVSALSSAERIRPNSYADTISNLGYDSVRAYSPVYALYRSIATVSLSFDDGRGDNTDVLDSMLIPRGIPATLNISTGYIDGTCPDELKPTDKTPMTIEDIRRFSRNRLVEIAMHGDCHQNTEEDILRGRKKLKTWLGLSDKDELGFASPGSGLSVAKFKTPECERLRRSMVYLRTSLRINSIVPLRILSRKTARVIHSAFMYRFGYHDTVMTEPDGQIIYSIPIMRDTTVSQVVAIVRESVRKRGAIVLMLHSIMSDTSKEDNWTWDKQKLESLCCELSRMEQNGKLVLCRTIDQYHLLQERE